MTDNGAGCRGGDASTSPPTLYKAMQACVQQHNYPQAVSLFALAGSYSWYDATRAGNDAARQQHQDLLRQALDGLEKPQREKMWQHLRETLGEPQPLAQICRQLEPLGPPTYRATYMAEDNDGENAPDPAIWRQAMDNYLHCAA